MLRARLPPCPGCTLTPRARQGLLGAKVMGLGTQTLTWSSIIKCEVKVSCPPAPAIYISIKDAVRASVLAIWCKNAPVRVGVQVTTILMLMASGVYDSSYCLRVNARGNVNFDLVA